MILAKLNFRTVAHVKTKAVSHPTLISMISVTLKKARLTCAESNANEKNILCSPSFAIESAHVKYGA